MIQLLFLTLVYQQRYQPPPDKELYPTTEYLSNAMIAGRWERAKTLLKEIGSFKKAKYQAQGKHIISDLCQYSGASDRYANVLTGIRMVYEAGADPTGNRNGAIAGTTGKDQWGQITERLLQYGVNPNDRCGGNESSQGSPPLLASVLYNPKTIATEVLLKYGADPNTLNIAEGNGKYTGPDRCRYFDHARGSALECSAALDVLVAKDRYRGEELVPGKDRLWSIVSMLVGLIKANSDYRMHDQGQDYDYE